MDREASVVSIGRTDSGDETYLVERAGLRADIAGLIKRHRKRKVKPPFTAAALIVMAIVSSDEEHLSRLAILKWIIKSFKYYTNQALARYLKFTGTRVTDTHGTVDGFDEAFDEYDIPLVVIEEEEYFHELDEEDIGEGTGRYSVNTRAARIFFRAWLEPKREGTFRFFDLPAELRNTIYDMTFQFPTPGVYIGLRRDIAGRAITKPEYYFRGLRAMSRTHDPEASRANRFEHGKSVSLLPLKEILTILLVCKQMYTETTRTFYQINTFRLQDAGLLDGLSQRMDAKCFSSINRIYLERANFDHMPEALLPACWTSAVEVLAKQVSCSFLSLMMHDDYWLEMPKTARLLFGRKTKFTKICQIPGFDRLAIAVSRVKEFELRGNCPLIKAFLDEEVAKITSGVGKLSKPYIKRTKIVKTPKVLKLTPLFSNYDVAAGGQTKFGAGVKHTGMSSGTMNEFTYSDAEDDI